MKARSFGEVDAKKMALQSYGSKVTTLTSQINAIQNEKQLKLQQAQNKIRQSLLKVKSDSMDLEAVKTQIKIANTQYNRSITLNKEWLKPMTDVEEKRLKLQEVEAKIITQENKLLGSKNELIISRVEVNRIQAEYSEKVSKAESDAEFYQWDFNYNEDNDDFFFCFTSDGINYRGEIKISDEYQQETGIKKITKVFSKPSIGFSLYHCDNLGNARGGRLRSGTMFDGSDYYDYSDYYETITNSISSAVNSVRKDIEMRQKSQKEKEELKDKTISKDE
jgi:hypothetical protein